MHVMFFLICIAAFCCSDVYAALRGNVQSHEVSERSYSTIPGYYCFRDIDGMTDAMFDLEKQYPELVSIQSKFRLLNIRKSIIFLTTLCVLHLFIPQLLANRI